MKKNRQITRRMRQLGERIRPILNTHWDPIGVGAEMPDEYDSYIPTIARLLDTGADARRIAGHLAELERAEMGATPNPARAASAAEHLLALVDEPDADHELSDAGCRLSGDPI